MSATSKSPAQDIAQFLSDAGYTSLYSNYSPDSPDAVIVVTDSGGLPADRAMGSKNVKFELPSVQILCRDSNGQTAYATAYAIYRLLDGERVQTINSNSYDLFECLQAPFSMGEDENERKSFAFNVQLTRTSA